MIYLEMLWLRILPRFLGTLLVHGDHRVLPGPACQEIVCRTVRRVFRVRLYSIQQGWIKASDARPFRKSKSMIGGIHHVDLIYSVIDSFAKAYK